MSDLYLTGYYTILLPYTTTQATKWHPTKPTGPFSLLSRGAFPDMSAMMQWAAENLEQGPWSYRWEPGFLDTCDENERAEYFALVNIQLGEN